MESYGPAGSAVDIGANVGFYTLALARAGWNVTAFEPLSSNIKLLSASLCRNPDLASRITLHTVGLGPRPEHCTIISRNANVGDGQVRCGPPVSARVQGYESRGGFDLQRLDDVLAEQKLSRIDFLKIDVEGFECEVLAGGPSVLSKYRPRLIQSEVWYDMENCAPAEYLAKFRKAKYVIAKEKTCEMPTMSVDRAIQDFWMCRESKLSLLTEQVSPKVDSHMRGIVLLRAA